MILAITSLAFAIPQELSERDSEPLTDAQYSADLGAERAHLVEQMAADQARIDQIDGELARLTGTPVHPVRQPTFIAVILDANLQMSDAVADSLRSASGSIATCYGEEPYTFSGTFRNIAWQWGVSLVLSRKDHGSIPEADRTCIAARLKEIHFPETPFPYNVKFIFG